MVTKDDEGYNKAKMHFILVKRSLLEDYNLLQPFSGAGLVSLSSIRLTIDLIRCSAGRIMEFFVLSLCPLCRPVLDWRLHQHSMCQIDVL